MSRSLPYRLECPEKCLHAQDEALNSTFFIVRQTGPTAFVLKEDGERMFKVVAAEESENEPSCNRLLARSFSAINISVLVMLFNASEKCASTCAGFC